MMATTKHQALGFSMIEVLVSLVIIAFGLLGLSRMQAAAMGNTQIARARSLISLQASSLAASMHGNRGFWAQGAAPASISAKGTTITDGSSILNATADCSPTAAATCTPAQMAAYDVQTWVANMNDRFPTYTAQITCTTAVGQPISCVIEVAWSEKYIAINRSTTTAGGATQTAAQQFSLYVEP
ncbi:type IV pilus modification protein PilV [Variovorax sp. Sphag1AA]|uniref:type IV pilus modification protein PilV n=1 Tax=Variovorax sp. Sphag1AA TaxID=2587027 RepID=UPI001620D8EA|nr:type IV pilus modification protein PilV [Variovorax sp. Sphag1AA]MBB3180507.1 type IV pilus assembly protein PilV [Variovorax sp. Sphag1AA]